MWIDGMFALDQSTLLSVILVLTAVIMIGWRVYVLVNEELFNSPESVLHKYKYSHEGYYPIKGESNRFVETGSFTNQSGVELLTYSTPPKFRPGNGICNPQIPKAIWIMAPTVGSPATRWSSTAHQVSQLGYAAYSMDYQGFGASKGESAVITNYENLVRDLLDFSGKIQDRYPGVPMFLVGHGYGASLALLSAVTDPHMFQGLILLAPVVRLDVGPFLKRCLPVLGAIFPRYKGLAVWPPLDATSANLEVALLNEKEPHFCRGPMCTVTARELSRMTEAAVLCMREVTTPVFIQHGQRDLITPYHHSRIILEQAVKLAPPQKRMLVLQQLWHDLLLCKFSADIVDNMVEWSEERLEIIKLQASLD